MEKMRRYARQQAALKFDELVMSLLLALAGAVIGTVIMGIVLWREPDAGFFPIGTVLGMMLSLIVVVFSTADNMAPRAALSMGCTRKQFFIGDLCLTLAELLLILLVLAGISFAEEWLFAGRMAATEESVTGAEIREILCQKGIWAAMGLTALVTFIRSMILRYEKRAFWVFWVVWMFGCIGGPRIIDAVEEAPDSLFGRLGNAVIMLAGRFSAAGWLGIGALASAVLLVIAFCTMRRLPVR